MLISIAITIFIIFYAISGFSWRMGCHLFGSTFFLPLVVALLALSWRFLDIQSALVFVSAKIAQSQVRAKSRLRSSSPLLATDSR